MQHVLDRSVFSTTRFIVISKSGETVETLFQFLAALQAAENAGLTEKFDQMFLAVTEPSSSEEPNSLRRICEKYNIPILDHPAGVGGRYSVFTSVGILPALARGIDIEAFLGGARNVIDTITGAQTVKDCPPAMSAALISGLAAERSIDIRVMMPYADRLARFSNWFVQLWAESLGKNGTGTTPIAALGPVDQHRQLQLFFDGPRRHLVTLVTHESKQCGPSINEKFAKLLCRKELQGRSVSDLVVAEQRAIYEALIPKKRPVVEISMPEIPPKTWVS